MTPLTKPITRRTVVARDAGRRVVVILEPGDLIGFRLERQRKVFRLPLIACYHMAVKAETLAKRKARKK